MKVIPVEEAEGMVLCHDITEIVPGQFKGQAFCKGHIVRKEDIPHLLQLGKEHLYVWDLNEERLHENEAAERFARVVAGCGLQAAAGLEGKVELKAACNGLLKINVEVLEQINDLGEIALVTLHNNQIVTTGQLVAGCKIIPLVVEESKLIAVEQLCQGLEPLVQVKALLPRRVGIVTTGSEVYKGRIQDKFGPVLTDKFTALGSSILRQIVVDDKVEMIVGAINTLLAEGAELIVTTGGMSVDPDDVTPAGIKAAGGEIIAYGAPTLPGAMFMLAYMGQTPVLGLPGCVMYHKNTIFDLLIPRILAGERLQRRDISRLGHGGLCGRCQECHYPNCSFGKC